MDIEEKDKKYWFRNKKFGIGWVPASWEGWLVLAAYLIGAILIALQPYYLGDGLFIRGEAVHQVEANPLSFIYFTILFVGFIAIVVKKGEKLKPNFVSRFFNKLKGNEQSEKVENRKD